uniref:Uncharacterized protein n=1 Tax=uncultured bacterium A1Q1_fos_504 TaxID=1256580 RepID=L7VWJ6_9BACT|nr:hypothetical protein [uncultured bacterium A1Q1_fos_504]
MAAAAGAAVAAVAGAALVALLAGAAVDWAGALRCAPTDLPPPNFLASTTELESTIASATSATEKVLNMAPPESKQSIAQEYGVWRTKYQPQNDDGYRRH